MRDRLIELLRQVHFEYSDECFSCLGNWDQDTPGLAEFFADRLLANGVVVLDMGVVSPKNRPLITHIAGMTLNDVAELIKQNEELSKTLYGAMGFFEGRKTSEGQRGY